MRLLRRDNPRLTLIADLLLAAVAVVGLFGLASTPSDRLAPKTPGNGPATITTEQYDKVEFSEGGKRWLFVVTNRSTAQNMLPAELTVYRDGVIIYRQLGETEGWTVGLEIDRMLLSNGRSLVCALEYPGAGHPYARHFFRIQNHQLVRAVKLGGENGGPEFRDLDGDGKPEWVFDNFSWYEQYNRGPDRFVAFKESTSGQLRLWKTLPNPKQRRIRERFKFYNTAM